MKPDASTGISRNYDRPHQDWVCGQHACGVTCPLGPSPLGICQRPSACEPHLENGRWMCNRSVLQGGACEEGPLPDGTCCQTWEHCLPVRSLRKRRGLLTHACFAFTIGFLIYMMQQPSKIEVLAPGGLSKNHAQILSRDTHENRCVACHAAGDKTFVEWIAMAFGGHPGNSESQSMLCLNCHDKSLSDEFALHPHGVSPDHLAGLQKSILPKTDRIATVSSHRTAAHLACATCHREHHGSDHDLARMADQQCANCHQSSFSTFEDHTEFSQWPEFINKRIRFTHTAHQFKHFPKTKAKFDCNQCHKANGNQVTSIRSYDTCKSCHDEKITNPSSEGFVFFALPMIDIEAFTEFGFDVGEWPEYATGDFDGPLSEAMVALLATYPEMENTLNVLGDDCDFINIDADDENQLNAAFQIVQVIKQLLNELSSGNPSSLRRMASTFGISPDNLDSTFPLIQFQQAHRAWFGVAKYEAEPNSNDMESEFSEKNDEWIDGELDKKNEKEERRIEDRPQEDSAVEDLLGRGKSSVDLISFEQEAQDTQRGWSIDHQSFTVRYRPMAHADPVLRELLSGLVDHDFRRSKRLYNSLSRANSVGQCMSCHQPRKSKTGTQIDWANSTNEYRKSFTRFSHAPHLIQPQLQDCRHCHQPYLDDQRDREITHRHLEFKEITKATCVSCHSPKAAGASCLKCHNYHILAPSSHAIPFAKARHEIRR